MAVSCFLATVTEPETGLRGQSQLFTVQSFTVTSRPFHSTVPQRGRQTPYVTGEDPGAWRSQCGGGHRALGVRAELRTRAQPPSPVPSPLHAGRLGQAVPAGPFRASALSYCRSAWVAWKVAAGWSRVGPPPAPWSRGWPALGPCVWTWPDVP